MQHFLSVLNNTSTILGRLPSDSLLYGKQETIISSSLSVHANSLIFGSNSPSPGALDYYKTEVPNNGYRVDIARLNNAGIMEFGCECKYRYTSDIGKNITIKPVSNYPILSSASGQQTNDLDYIICYALEQIKNGTASSPASTNNMVLLNLVCVPFGTNGFFTTNSGLKYIDPTRIQFDIQLLGTNSISFLPAILDQQIRNFPLTKSLYPNLRCLYQNVTLLKSYLGFDYCIITLSY